ncbi:hypothetical protein CYR40_20445 [Chimaeribacter arupi]|uniref:type II secretion system protein GspM n=1 Tax=Chimaeribacter arupi TaxID=2060066 RepID=UPI000C7D5E87|nr:type II secretion system protein GspM [Chimaeribacter arupi]PLR42493.1 hypothetical protein CYR40_20445 [Chimaeribacter arupi]
MKTWFMAHTRREQHILLFIGALIIGALIWFALLTPLNNLAEKLQRNNKQAQQTLTWMKEESIKRGIIPGIKKTQPLEAVIKSSAEKYRVVIDNTSTENKSVHVTVKKMLLSDFIHWLIDLKKTSGVTASQVEFSSAEQEGYINITALTFVRK